MARLPEFVALVRPAAGMALPLGGAAGVVVLVVATSGMPGPPVVQLVAALTGMGMVVLAWLGLVLHRVEFSARRLYWIAAAWCLPLLFARPLFSADVRSYLAQGVIAAKGLDPYRLGPAAALGADSPVTQQVSHYWQNTPAPYGPVALAISRAIAHFAGQNVPATVLLNRLAEFAGLALVAWALPRLARRTGVPVASALVLGLLNPLVLWHVVAGAHNDGLMLGLMLAGMEIALTGASRPPRIVAGLVLLTIAANIKVVAAATVCCLGAELARRRGGGRGGVLVMAGLLAGFVAISIAIGDFSGLGLGWISTLGAPGQLHSWLAPTNQLGFLVGALAGASFTSAAITASIRVGAVIGAAAGVGLLWGTFRGRWHPMTGLGLVFAVLLVAGPVVQPWYLLWAILPLAASVRADRPRRVLAVTSALFAMLLPPVGGGAAVLIAGYLGAAVLLATILIAALRSGASGAVSRETPATTPGGRGSA